MKSSPSPWKVEGYKGLIVNDARGITLAMCPGGGDDVEQMQANARLIAAAPALLQSLIDVMGWFDSSPIRQVMTRQGYQAECHRIINEARTAIREAGQ